MNAGQMLINVSLARTLTTPRIWPLQHDTYTGDTQAAFSIAAFLEVTPTHLHSAFYRRNNRWRFFSK